VLYLDLTLQGLIQGSTYALIAVGLTLVYGLLRVLHVAHAGLFTLGAYLGVLLTNALGSLWLAAALAVPLVGLAGMAVYRLLYEPLLDRPPFVALIASIGLFIAMEEAFRLIFGPYGNAFDRPPLEGALAAGAFRIQWAEAASVAAALLLLGGLGLLASRTRLGLAWRATVSDPEMAGSFGVEIRKVRYLNFFVGSALALACNFFELGCEVYSGERHESLVHLAIQNLREAGYEKVRVKAGDGSKGWPEAAPFQAILVTAAAESRRPAHATLVVAATPARGPRVQRLRA